MTIDGSQLPVELVLMILEHAAWDDHARCSSWVASLACINRCVSTTVTRILYETLKVTIHNLPRLAEVARQQNGPLRFVRHVFFSILFTRSVSTEDKNFHTLLGALSGIREFTGTDSALKALILRHPTLLLESVFITETTEPFRSPEHKAYLHSSHLHFIVTNKDVSPDDNDQLPSHNTQYLIIDAFAPPHDRPPALDTWMPDFVVGLAGFLRNLPRLQRMLLRPRLAHVEDSEAFCRHIRTWAASARDTRVWLDDVYIGEEGSPEIYDQQDAGDIIRGTSLWIMGTQQYASGSM